MFAYTISIQDRVVEKLRIFVAYKVSPKMKLIPHSFVEVVDEKTDKVRKHDNAKGKLNATS